MSIEHLRAAQLRERIVGSDLERAIGGVERAGQVADAAAVGGQQQQRRGVVGLRARRLLDHLVRLGGAAGAVVEARERVDQLEIARLGRERVLQHLLGVGAALLRDQEARERRPGRRALLGLRDLDRLAEGGLGLGVAALAGQEGRERGPAADRGVELGELRERRLGLGLPSARAQVVGEQQQRQRLIGRGVDRRLVRGAGVLGLAERRERARLQQQRLPARRLDGEDRVGALDRPLELFLLAEEQELAVAQARLDVARVEADRLLELPVGAPRVLAAEERQREPVVGGARCSDRRRARS